MLLLLLSLLKQYFFLPRQEMQQQVLLGERLLESLFPDMKVRTDAKRGTETRRVVCSAWDFLRMLLMTLLLLSCLRPIFSRGWTSLSVGLAYRPHPS